MKLNDFINQLKSSVHDLGYTTRELRIENIKFLEDNPENPIELIVSDKYGAFSHLIIEDKE